MRSRRERIVTPIMNAELKIATLSANWPVSNCVWLTRSSATSATNMNAAPTTRLPGLARDADAHRGDVQEDRRDALVVRRASSA